MLDAYIIEEIKKREEEKRRRAEEQPRIPLPLPEGPFPEKKEDKEEKRVVIIDPADGYQMIKYHQ